MDVIIIIGALVFLMFLAYRGFSVILVAPAAALIAVLFTYPSLSPVFFSGIYMEKMVGFIRLYFPVFLLGAIFGKLFQISGAASSITKAITRRIGSNKAMFAIVLVGALLTYGGVSLFVVAFAVYPFAAELFKLADIPKRLIPGTIALGAFTFTMDAFPGSPQIQNIIPTTFFNTDTWAAPWLGLIGGLFVFISGMLYLEKQRKLAAKRGEGYGDFHSNEPTEEEETSPGALISALPLVLVALCNAVFSMLITKYHARHFNFSTLKIDAPPLDASKLVAIWAVEGALIVGIITLLVFNFRRIRNNFKIRLNEAVPNALLAILNTASEYGFGAVIAALPGFVRLTNVLSSTFRDPLINEAITTTTLAGVTGSASGGLSIALGAMSHIYLSKAAEAGIPPEVLHRVAAMASGGLDTLPHNGAVITLLAITGLTHKQSYKDIFVMTIFKTAAVFLVILLFRLFGLV